MTGQEDFDQLRPLAYYGADVIVICYSTDSRTSLENVYETWAPEVSHFAPAAPVLLAGCKLDLRDDPQTLHRLAKNRQAPVSSQEVSLLVPSISLSFFWVGRRENQNRNQN